MGNRLDFLKEHSLDKAALLFSGAGGTAAGTPLQPVQPQSSSAAPAAGLLRDVPVSLPRLPGRA